jgi:hypothetical protein
LTIQYKDMQYTLKSVWIDFTLADTKGLELSIS